MHKALLVISIAFFVLAIGVFVWVSDAPAYAGKEAETCANCHVMDAAYEGWMHAPHQRVTECADCHLPHDNVLNYWVAKARTGLHDLYAFSTGQIPVIIRAKPGTKEIVRQNCIRCHMDTVESMLASSMPLDRNCWDCHRDVAHGPRGLSSSPYQDSIFYPTSNSK
ncbi:MAG: cytochrome c nitrite reductase small subunit [Anaerolineales bacterium]